MAGGEAGVSGVEQFDANLDENTGKYYKMMAQIVALSIDFQKSLPHRPFHAPIDHFFHFVAQVFTKCVVHYHLMTANCTLTCHEAVAWFNTPASLLALHPSLFYPSFSVEKWAVHHKTQPSLLATDDRGRHNNF